MNKDGNWGFEKSQAKTVRRAFYVFAVPKKNDSEGRADGRLRSRRLCRKSPTGQLLPLGRPRLQCYLENH